jgi:hypothetical protein
MMFAARGLAPPCWKGDLPFGGGIRANSHIKTDKWQHVGLSQRFRFAAIAEERVLGGPNRFTFRPSPTAVPSGSAFFASPGRAGTFPGALGAFSGGLIAINDAVVVIGFTDSSQRFVIETG